MDTVNALGLAAGTLTTLAFVPQVVKVWKTRHARDLSLGTFAIFSAGVMLWLIYGLRLGAWPIVIANAITLALSLILLLFMLKYR